MLDGCEVCLYMIIPFYIYDNLLVATRANKQMYKFV